VRKIRNEGARLLSSSVSMSMFACVCLCLCPVSVAVAVALSVAVAVAGVNALPCGVATISRLLKITGLFCRISSLS